jgi:transposase InsO family protein
VLQGKLYKKSISGVLQQCVTPQEGQEILKDIHAGVCGYHASSRSITAKAFRAGFYWLTAIEDAKDIVRKCKACQSSASRPHAPAAELQPIPDNGTNFTSKEFKDYCEGLGIKLKFASVAHPTTNGQVEKANGLICSAIKKRLLAPLEKAKHAWIDELPSVLWSLRTTPSAATQETHFFLVHGAEAVLPVEITHEAPRITTYDETTSIEAL